MMFIKRLNRIKTLAFYKRTVFLVNPRFQLRFSAIVSSIMLLASLLYPIILLDFFDEVMTKIPQSTSDLAQTRKNLIIFLFIIQVFFSAMVFILFIFFTHKIAGPMFKLKNHLEKIRQGGPIFPLTFRDGDHFHDVAQEVSLFLETINTNQENDFQYLDEISIYLDNLAPVLPDDKKPVLSEISRKLLAIKSRYKKSL